ncbi:MAG: hypothetical protein V3R86_04925, partial [Candidatus Hydrothermarchaeaceae archaeon]
KYYPKNEPRMVLAINTFLDDSKYFLKRSIESVIWIKEVDVTDGVKQSADKMRELAKWVRTKSEGMPVEAFYVVDEELMEHLGTGHYQNMWNVKEIFKERAVEYGAQYLHEMKKIFDDEGIDLEIKVSAGNFIAGLGHELGERGSVIVGQNALAIEVLNFISNEIIEAPKDIYFVSPKKLITEVKKDGKLKLSRIDKLNRYLSVKGKIKDVLITDGGEKSE